MPGSPERAANLDDYQFWIEEDMYLIFSADKEEFILPLAQDASSQANERIKNQ